MEPREDIEAIRQTLMTRGWRDHIAPALAKKMDQAKTQAILTSDERSGEFKPWTTDRISGFTLGLGWCLNTFLTYVQTYDRERMLAMAEQKAQQEADTPLGSPHSMNASDREALEANNA